ncbi:MULTISPECIES: hypothetical protein [unclassified Brenneria]|uniref:hypothetical protein n=1 Tax=unclassified Brenneria TaxID=2634434 RepID=UPI0029C1F921|nr:MULTISPECIES: hypothetical protein [unclassified Brenneria]MDX5630995.1 hypothetical protein [Brenneria sp. L3-3Z]MDX5698076.1 hypothetical protein [Brenneria sp. L4-2C]
MLRLPAGLADAPLQRVIAEADVNLRRIVVPEASTTASSFPWSVRISVPPFTACN